MPNTREKLIELLNIVQHHGVIFQPSQVDDRYGYEKQIPNATISDHLIANGVTIPIRCEECRLHMNCPTEERFHNVKAESRYCCLGERRNDK